MTRPPPPRTGGEILTDALLLHGVETVFCVPGESYLAALDALYGARNRIDVVACRQEGGAAFMAEAFAKATARPGVCFVTRGPGACNAAIGVHTAMQDSTPMVLFVGQVARDASEREGVPGNRLPPHVRAGGQTGPPDRRPAAHPRTRPPRLPRRRFGASGAGGRRPPRRRSARARANRRRTALRSRAPPPRAGSDNRLARPARRRRTPPSHARRFGLERSRLRRHARVRGSQRAAGLRLVPPSGPVRQRPSQLCRRPLDLRQPAAHGAPRRGRPAARRRRSPRRDHDPRLRRARHPRAAPDTRPHLPRSRGDRPRLPAGAVRRLRRRGVRKRRSRP